MKKKGLETSNIYSSMQLELKYKQQINNFLLQKKPSIREEIFIVL
jgi:hypothetical protein